MVEELGLIGAGAAAAAVLAKRASDAVGGLYRPWQIRRIAEAEADEKLIRTQADIEAENLQQRARSRAHIEEQIHQNNMELILAKSINHLDEDDASPEKMEQDWIINFFEKGRLISDEGMQELWARILAGEANRPGSFSRKTINIMEDIGKADAELFVSACAYAWTINSTMIPIFDSSGINKNPIYLSHGIRFLTLQHLEDIGLLRYNSLTGFAIHPLNKIIHADYFGKLVTIDLQDQDGMRVSDALFTIAGQELYEIFRSTLRPVDGFFDFVYNKWAEKALGTTTNITQGSQETTPTARP